MLWNLLLGLIFLGANKYGVYITDECPQESYSCPKICDVDHIHLPEKECRYAKSQLSSQESRQESRKENWKESNKEKGILINGKAEQESRPDTTTVSSSR